jgi:hypothetical protein
VVDARAVDDVHPIDNTTRTTQLVRRASEGAERKGEAIRTMKKLY